MATYIKQFGLEHFLSYAKQEPIDLGRLNIFVGKNSSGKSAILHALALLSETVSDPSRHTSLLLAGEGLNLGTYQDVVHKNKNTESISFDLTMGDDWDPIRRPDKNEPNRFRFTFKQDVPSRRPYVSAIAPYLPNGDRCFTLQGYPATTSLGYRSAGIVPFRRKPAGVVAWLDHFLPYFQPQVPTYRETRFARNMEAFWSVNRASRDLLRILIGLVYFGPSRASLDAVYFPVGRFPSKLDSTGSNAVPYILGRARTKRDRARFASVLETWLSERFELVSRAGLTDLAGGQGFRLQGLDPLIRATVVLSNTGYGVSQILPIVIQLGLGSPGVLLIEQPEIHLHPRAQAELADLLVAFVTQGYQLLVETHSEHLVLRLRALVVRGKSGLKPKDVKLFHVEKTTGGSRINPVELEASGRLKGWPKGFFAASTRDMVDVLAGSEQ